MNDYIKIFMELVNNGLFPIACCAGLVFIIFTMFKSYREDLKKLNEQHEQETKDFTQALNKNTQALNKLCDKLERGEDNDKK